MNFFMLILYNAWEVFWFRFMEITAVRNRKTPLMREFPGKLQSWALSDEMDEGVFHVVEKHKGGDGHGPVFGDFSGFVEADFFASHSGHVNPSGERESTLFGTETGEAMGSVVAVAPVFIGGVMSDDVEILGEGVF
jgi:hypothetical protein